jgi:hypothetical protein
MRARILAPSAILLSIGLVVCLSTLWISYSLRRHSVPAEIAEGVREVVRRSPHLQSMYDAALEDGVLTMVEANRILGAAENKPNH